MLLLALRLERKKKTESSPAGIFEPAPQLPPAQKVSPRTTFKIYSLQVFSLPFMLFEPCGGVFIMNSKINLRENSLTD